MSEIGNFVMQRGDQRFDICGQKLPDSLHDMEDKISEGLIKRLHKFALKRLSEAGFEVTEWKCEIYTMDGGKPPPERYYCVEFSNAKGGIIGVQGILTNRGHPCLDHGLCIGNPT